jgi:hypothetical protein
MGEATVTMTDCTITDNLRSSISPGGLFVGPNGKVTLINTHVTFNTAGSVAGVEVSSTGELTLDPRSRVMRNTAGPSGIGGIRATASGSTTPTVTLQSVDNVTDNEPNDCGGNDPSFTGPGAVCTET